MPNLEYILLTPRTLTTTDRWETALVRNVYFTKQEDHGVPVEPNFVNLLKGLVTTKAVVIMDAFSPTEDNLSYDEATGELTFHGYSPRNGSEEMHLRVERVDEDHNKLYVKQEL